MAANAAQINISPTRRSPRHANTNVNRVHLIHQRPSDNFVNAAQTAILEDNMAELRRVLSVCKEGWFGSEGVYLLHFAANRGGSAESIEFLTSLAVAEGYPIDKYNAENRTPLFCACENGHYDAAKKLIEMGARLEACDMHRNTPLHISASKNYHRIVELLLNNNADVHALTAGASTPLHRAAASAALESVKLLVEKGALITALNLQKRTPLYLARSHGAVDVAEYLQSLAEDNEVDDAARMSPRRTSTQSTPTSSPSTPKSTPPSTTSTPSSPTTPTTTSTAIVAPDHSSKRSAEKIKKEVKKEKSSKRLKVDEEVSFRCASPYDSPVPSPANTTTVTHATLVPQAPARAADWTTETKMGPPSSPIRNIKSPSKSRSPLPVKPETRDKVVKVKRKEDELFWEVKVPAGCTFQQFAAIIKNKIGGSFTTIAKGNVRIVDAEDVDRLVSACELIVY